MCSLSRSGLGPSRAEVGFGSRLVGCVRRFCPPPPPLVGFWPVVRPFFLFPCPFRVCPFQARCVGVGVFSFPSVFCVPPLVFRLSNCHLIFIVISLPFFHIFSLNFTFVSFVGALNAPRQRGVCVKHLNRCKPSTVTLSILILACVISRDFKQGNFHICACLPGFRQHYFTLFQAGGQCTTDSHCPTKTLSVRGDTEPDQLCVPASVLSFI